MNKLVMLPLGIMLLLTIYASVYTGEEYVTDSVDLGTVDEMQINGTPTGQIELPGDSEEFNMWGLEGAFIILIIAIALGIAAGIRVLGSGLSDEAGHIIFASTVYLGLWGVLTIVVTDFMFGTLLISMLWLILTIIYVIGVTMDINGTGD